MPDQIPKPENVPSFEDIEKALGMDAMSFMSEMLSEPGETEKNRLLNEAQTTQMIGNDKNKPAELSPREAEVIAYLEREEGRKFTQQEVNLALDQARDIGHL